MRPIKFRAWDKKEKRMFGRMWPKMQIESDGTFGFPDDELYAVMQFTGLTDKNGKEIYEGDILTNGGIRAYVRYAAGATGFVLNYKDTYIGMPADWENREIIGNVYETPELLK